MRFEKLGKITKSLDNKRIPLNSSQRERKSKEGLYPYIGANNIMGYINEFIFDEKILCLAEDGGSWGERETCANIYNEKCWVNNHAHVLIENGKANLEYLRFYLNTANLNQYITGTTRGKLTKSALESILVPLPSLEDQIRIATLLSKAEALIKQRKESIDLLDEYLKSKFLEMFGDPVKNEKGWKKVPLKKFGQIITGNTPPRGDLDNFSDNYIEWIKTDNIPFDNLYISKAKEYLSEQGLKKSRFVDKGALLVACIAGSIESVGRASLTDRTVSFNQQINAIQPNEDINSLFLYCLFKNTKSYIQNQASKGMKKILTKGEFEKILMIKPPKDLQNKFASILEKTESQKAQYKSSLAELENLYGSLSQKAFKGELNLSNLSVYYEEEYSASDNDRTELHHFNKPINLDTISVEPTAKRAQNKITEFSTEIGNAIIKNLAKQMSAGFSFQEYVQKLKEEKVTFTKTEIIDFIFDLLKSEKLIQFYASKEWMYGINEVRNIDKEYKGDEGNIWFIVTEKL